MRTIKQRALIAGVILSLIVICAVVVGKKRMPPNAPSSAEIKSPQKIHKVLYVDSYHHTYPWSAGIATGIKRGFYNRRDVELRTFSMDSKRNSSEESIQAAAQAAQELIETWDPDVIITSDDNAAKYLLIPFQVSEKCPVVFCGINWDASGYGFPGSNVTGMVEVQLIDRLIDAMKPYARGNRIAIIKGDDLSAQIETDLFEKRFNVTLDRRFVHTFDEWISEYKNLQNEANMILVGNAASIIDWDPEQAHQVIHTETRIPTANWDAWMAPYCLITIATKPQEQGAWAASAALKILDGTTPSEIPLATNRQAEIFLNMPLAKKMQIRFPMTLIENAHLISAEAE
jgi:ABC-type uncharacterized transport system substrate-binding protein